MVFAPRRAVSPKTDNIRVLGPDGLPLDGRDEPLDLTARSGPSADPLEFSEAAIAAELPPEMRRYREAFASVSEARRAAENVRMDMQNPEARNTLRRQRMDQR